MSPIAVPAAQLAKVLHIKTRVNGERRQTGSTEDLISPVAKLISTLSAAITLQPRYVIASGTPARVGFGQDPPQFLNPGDTVEVSVTGLGKLVNTVADSSKTGIRPISPVSVIPLHNLAVSAGGASLTQIGAKMMNVLALGDGTESIVCVRVLGGITEFYRPLVQAASLTSSHKHILYDLEGHGQTPMKASSVVSMESLVTDLKGVVSHSPFSIKAATIVAHSLEGLIALSFALAHPTLVRKLVLIDPGPSPLPAAASKATYARAAVVHDKRILASGVAHAVTTNGTSAKTKAQNSLALSMAGASLLSQDAEGYAKGCMALAGSVSTSLEIEKIEAPTLVVVGADDRVSTVELARKMEERMQKRRVEILGGVGYWHHLRIWRGWRRRLRTLYDWLCLRGGCIIHLEFLINLFQYLFDLCAWHG